MIVLAVFAVLGGVVVFARVMAQRAQRRTAAFGGDPVGRLAELLREAEHDQYVPLSAVDAGHIREVAARAFIGPPSGDVVVLVGTYSECNHTIDVLHLNPLRVVVAEYPWRLHELPAGLRVIVLPSAIELPQIEGIMECLRSMGDARYVRLLV